MKRDVDFKTSARMLRQKRAATGDWEAAATLILERAADVLPAEVDRLIAAARSMSPADRRAFAREEVLTLRIQMEGMRAVVRDILARNPGNVDALEPVMTVLAREPARLGTLEASLLGDRPSDSCSPAWIAKERVLTGHRERQADESSSP